MIIITSAEEREASIQQFFSWMADGDISGGKDRNEVKEKENVLNGSVFGSLLDKFEFILA